MADTAKQVRAVIQQRLDEIADEAARLEAAIKHLGGGSGGGRGGAPKRSPRSSARGKARRGTRKRAAAGERAEQFLAFVKQNPGSKGITIAGELGVNPSQVYSLAKPLEKAGRIKKSKGSYRVSAG